LKPVEPALVCTNQELSELIENLPLLPFVTSYSSVIPFGGAIVIELLAPKKPTTGMPSRGVVTAGAAIRREFDW
jgi:hypothetical protein